MSYVPLQDILETLSSGGIPDEDFGKYVEILRLLFVRPIWSSYDTACGIFLKKTDNPEFERYLAVTDIREFYKGGRGLNFTLNPVIDYYYENSAYYSPKDDVVVLAFLLCPRERQNSKQIKLSWKNFEHTVAASRAAGEPYDSGNETLEKWNQIARNTMEMIMFEDDYVVKSGNRGSMPEEGNLDRSTFMSGVLEQDGKSYSTRIGFTTPATNDSSKETKHQIYGLGVIMRTDRGREITRVIDVDIPAYFTTRAITMFSGEEIKKGVYDYYPISDIQRDNEDYAFPYVDDDGSAVLFIPKKDGYDRSPLQIGVDINCAPYFLYSSSKFEEGNSPLSFKDIENTLLTEGDMGLSNMLVNLHPEGKEIGSFMEIEPDEITKIPKIIFSQEDGEDLDINEMLRIRGEEYGALKVPPNKNGYGNMAFVLDAIGVTWRLMPEEYESYQTMLKRIKANSEALPIPPRNFTDPYASEPEYSMYMGAYRTWFDAKDIPFETRLFKITEDLKEEPPKVKIISPLSTSDVSGSGRTEEQESREEEIIGGIEETITGDANRSIELEETLETTKEAMKSAKDKISTSLDEKNVSIVKQGFEENLEKYEEALKNYKDLHNKISKDLAQMVVWKDEISSERGRNDLSGLISKGENILERMQSKKDEYSVDLSYYKDIEKHFREIKDILSTISQAKDSYSVIIRGIGNQIERLKDEEISGKTEDSLEKLLNIITDLKTTLQNERKNAKKNDKYNDKEVKQKIEGILLTLFDTPNERNEATELFVNIEGDLFDMRSKVLEGGDYDKILEEKSENIKKEMRLRKIEEMSEQGEEEEEISRKEEEEQKRIQKTERLRKEKEEEEERRRKEEEERRRKEAEKKQIQQETERLRKEKEEEERRRKEEAEQKRIQQEAERRRKEEEEEEEEERRRKEEAEKKRIQQEAERRRKEEAEKKRLQESELKRKQEEKKKKKTPTVSKTPVVTTTTTTTGTPSDPLETEAIRRIKKTEEEDKLFGYYREIKEFARYYSAVQSKGVVGIDVKNEIKKGRMRPDLGGPLIMGISFINDNGKHQNYTNFIYSGKTYPYFSPGRGRVRGFSIYYFLGIIGNSYLGGVPGTMKLFKYDNKIRGWGIFNKGTIRVSFTDPKEKDSGGERYFIQYDFEHSVKFYTKDTIVMFYEKVPNNRKPTEKRSFIFAAKKRPYDPKTFDFMYIAASKKL